MASATPDQRLSPQPQGITAHWHRGTKSHCLVTETLVCEQLAQGCYKYSNTQNNQTWWWRAWWYAPADGSSTRGGSTSVRGRVRSPHISGGRPAAGSQRAYSLGWDKQADGSRYSKMPAIGRGHNKRFDSIVMSRILPSVLWRCWLGGSQDIRPGMTKYRKGPQRTHKRPTKNRKGALHRTTEDRQSWENCKTCNNFV